MLSIPGKNRATQPLQSESWSVIEWDQTHSRHFSGAIVLLTRSSATGTPQEPREIPFASRQKQQLVIIHSVLSQSSSAWSKPHVPQIDSISDR